MAQMNASRSSSSAVQDNAPQKPMGPVSNSGPSSQVASSQPSPSPQYMGGQGGMNDMANRATMKPSMMNHIGGKPGSQPNPGVLAAVQKVQEEAQRQSSQQPGGVQGFGGKGNPQMTNQQMTNNMGQQMMTQTQWAQPQGQHPR